MEFATTRMPEGQLLARCCCLSMLAGTASNPMPVLRRGLTCSGAKRSVCALIYAAPTPQPVQGCLGCQRGRQPTSGELQASVQPTRGRWTEALAGVRGIVPFRGLELRGKVPIRSLIKQRPWCRTERDAKRSRGGGRLDQDRGLGEASKGSWAEG